jgi:two-component sensor histidine kinase
VTPPTREGFGAKLLRRAARYELDGSATLTFAPEGLYYEIVFSLA